MEIDAVKNTAYQGSGSSIKETTEVPEIVIDSTVPDKKETSGLNEASNVLSGKDVSAKDLKKSVVEINSKLNKNTEAIFGIHEETNRVTIKIIDKESKEVLKEVPPEKTLEMIAKIWEFAGLLVDEKL